MRNLHSRNSGKKNRWVVMMPICISSNARRSHKFYTKKDRNTKMFITQTIAFRSWVYLSYLYLQIPIYKKSLGIQGWRSQDQSYKIIWMINEIRYTNMQKQIHVWEPYCLHTSLINGHILLYQGKGNMTQYVILHIGVLDFVYHIRKSQFLCKFDGV